VPGSGVNRGRLLEDKGQRGEAEWAHEGGATFADDYPPRSPCRFIQIGEGKGCMTWASEAVHVQGDCRLHFQSAGSGFASGIWHVLCFLYQSEDCGLFEQVCRCLLCLKWQLDVSALFVYGRDFDPADL